MQDYAKTTPGFCPNCGSILPQLKATGGVECYLCSTTYNSDVFGNMEVEYTVHFNTIPKQKVLEDNDDDLAEGPIVSRTCLKCGNKKMSYATLQLRSADEGQTVFFTCTKCGNKETENS
ncbi:unnamed protein product [Diamesa serratosioi]